MIGYTLIGQIGIGTKTPNKNAVLEVHSTEKGFLLPRITSSSRDAMTDTPLGLMIFNTTNNCMETYLGANGWASICGSVAPAPVVPPTNTTAPTSWVGDSQTTTQKTYRIGNENVDVDVTLSYTGYYNTNHRSYTTGSNVACFTTGFIGATNGIHLGSNGTTYGASSMKLTFSKPVTNIKFFITGTDNSEQFTFTTDAGTNGLSIIPFGGNCNTGWSVSANTLSYSSATAGGTMLNIGGIYFKDLNISLNSSISNAGSVLVMNYTTGSSALPN